MFKPLCPSRTSLTGLGLAAVAALALAAAPAPTARADGDRFSIGFGVQFSSHDRYRSHHRPYYDHGYRKTVRYVDRGYHRPYYRPSYGYQSTTVYRSPGYYAPPTTVIKRSYRPAPVYCPPHRSSFHQSKVVRVIDSGHRGKSKGQGNKKNKGKGKGKKR
ncbi:MAG: hypothetical protein AAF586_03155 [Planctomycetota bacterium]